MMTLTLVQVIVSGPLVGAVYALFSSGLTLIWGMMNVINFGHGDFVMVGMYTAFVVMVWLHGGPGWIVPAAALPSCNPAARLAREEGRSISSLYNDGCHGAYI